jgi:hypothetical protein
MALDVHKVRQISSDADRKLSDVRRDVERILGNFKNLGSGFTADRSYAREYSQLDSATKDALRALEKVQSAVKDINRKV